MSSVLPPATHDPADAVGAAKPEVLHGRSVGMAVAGYQTFNPSVARRDRLTGRILRSCRAVSLPDGLALDPVLGTHTVSWQMFTGPRGR